MELRQEQSSGARSLRGLDVWSPGTRARSAHADSQVERRCAPATARKRAKEVKKLSFLPGALARLAGLAARRCVLFAVFSSLPLGWVLGWPTSCGDPHRWQSCTQPSCHFLGWASDIIRSSNQNLTCLINKKKKVHHTIKGARNSVRGCERTRWHTSGDGSDCAPSRAGGAQPRPAAPPRPLHRRCTLGSEARGPCVVGTGTRAGGRCGRGGGGAGKWADGRGARGLGQAGSRGGGQQRLGRMVLDTQLVRAPRAAGSTRTATRRGQRQSHTTHHRRIGAHAARMRA